MTVEQASALAGPDITHAPPGRATHGRCCFRTNNLFPHLSVLQNSPSLRPDLRLRKRRNNPRRDCACTGIGLQDMAHANLRNCRAAAKPICGAGALCWYRRARWCYCMNPFAALGPPACATICLIWWQSWPQKPRSADHVNPRPETWRSYADSGDLLSKAALRRGTASPLQHYGLIRPTRFVPSWVIRNTQWCKKLNDVIRSSNSRAT